MRISKRMLISIFLTFSIALLTIHILCSQSQAVYRCGTETDDCYCGVNNPYYCCDNDFNDCGGTCFPCANSDDGCDGNCTWWAWEKACCDWGVALPGWGNAGSWATDAMGSGYLVNNMPAIYTIAASSHYNHVAWVQQVSSDRTTIWVSEMNCFCDGRCSNPNNSSISVRENKAYNVATWLQSGGGFIYPPLIHAQGHFISPYGTDYGNDPVFLLQNGTYYHIVSSEILNMMEHPDLPRWRWDRVKDVSATGLGEIFSNQSYIEGPEFITTDASSNGLLIRQVGTGSVYSVQDGQLEDVTFEWCQENNCWPNIINVTESIIDLFSADGYAAVSEGVTVTPSTIYVGDNFNVTVTLEEIQGAPITFAEVTCAILDNNDNLQFDLQKFSNVTVPANETWTYTGSGYMASQFPPGTYKAMARGRVTNWFDFTTTGSGVNPRIFQVQPQTLSVTLDANPSNGCAPLDVTLTAEVSGTATGTINYTFWWNCNDPGTSVEEVTAVCGDPTNPAVGMKFDGVSVEILAVNHIYSAEGTYTGKVITERGTALPAEDRVTVIVTSPPGAPSNCVASDNLCDKVHFCWQDNSNNEDGFKIYRNGSYIGGVGANVTCYDDNTASLGVTYSYCVKAYNNCGESSQCCDNGIRLTPPLAPSLSSPSNGAIDQSVPVYLEWDEVSGVDNYQVVVDSNSSFSSPQIDETTSSSYYNATGLNHATTYYWRVRAHNLCDWGDWSAKWHFTTVTTGVDDESSSQDKPVAFALSQNHPNPFNPETVIEYALPKDCQVQIAIYNLLGQKIRTLIDQYQTKGQRKIHWDGKDDEGNELTSGIYFYRLQAGDFSETKKMVLLR